MAVRVKIFGQEYNIAGEKSPEAIQKIAEYVDNKMRMISRMTGNEGLGPTAALTALNVAEEYFDTLDKIEEVRAIAEKTRKEAASFAQVADDAKRAYLQTKEELEKLKAEKSADLESYRELERRCSDFENSVFDLQMENIQLKSEIDKLSKPERADKKN